MKKMKLTACLLSAVMLLCSVSVIVGADASWRTIYVAPDGSDSADGSQSSPYKTLARAQQAVREINANMQGDIVVNIAEGTYYLEEPLEFRTEDSGTNGHRVIWRGINRPVISGGQEITGFVPSEEHPGLYEASVSGLDRIMQLYVNGKKRYMARTNYFVQGVKKPEKYDNADWYDAHPNDVRDESYNWYDPDTEYRWDGIYMSKKDIGFWENPQDILFQWERNWKTQIVSVNEILQDPDNADQVKVRMQRGFWNILLSCNYTGQVMYPSGDVRFRIINAMELLDSPGEFYYNRTAKKLYYMPEADEDMMTAKVVAPRLDAFATIFGNDCNACVKNIVFEGLTIAHFASNTTAEGYWGEQGTVVRASSGVGGTGRSGILMYFADGVHFYNNYFYGFDQVAINMQEGVYNCEITGNAFSDLGDAAVNIGHEIHKNDLSSPVPAGKKQLNLTSDYLRYAIYTSYIGDDYTNMTNYVGTLRGTSVANRSRETYVPDSGYQYKGAAWHSDPKDAENGEKSYVLYDFYSKYTLDKIALCWDSDYVSQEEKANFEILLSNDISFAPGTYVTAAIQNEAPSGEVAEYEVTDTGKYRYMMIQTLGAGRLALSRAYALTSDMKPYVYMAKPKNITISNNYMTRIGGEIPRSCAVMVYYADGLTLTHNELYDIAYSGFEIGWGWSSNDSSTKNVYCAYNHISTTNWMLYDGGPIYTLSRQPDSVYEYNYVENNIMGINSLYQDQGTAGTTWRSNAAENGAYVYSPYTDGIIDNLFLSSYGSHSTSAIAANGKETNVYEEVTPYAMGLPSEGAYAVISEAGLTKEYRYLISLVPTGVDNGLPEEAVSYSRVDDYGYRATYAKLHKQEADNMLSLGAFGTGLGQYPLALYKDFKEYNSNFGSSASIEQTVLMRNRMTQLKNSVNRVGLSETLAMIEDELDNARTISANCPCITSFEMAGLYNTFGMITDRDAEELRTRFKNLKSRAEGIETDYRLLTEAEALYGELQSKKFSADILYVSAADSVDCVIDEENAQVTVYFDRDAGLGGKQLDITVSPGATIAAALPQEVDLSAPILVPVYCAKNKGYRYWTVRGAYRSPESYAYTSAENWFSLRKDGNHVSETADGNLMLEHGVFANMSKSYNAEINGAELNFSPISQLPLKEFTMILGAESYEVDNSLKVENCNRFEIDFQNGLASLYKVTANERTLIRQSNSSIVYNEANSLVYRVTPQGNQTMVTVVLNGETLFNELTAGRFTAAYFGFLSNKVNIKIY